MYEKGAATGRTLLPGFVESELSFQRLILIAAISRMETKGNNVEFHSPWRVPLNTGAEEKLLAFDFLVEIIESWLQPLLGPPRSQGDRVVVHSCTIH